MGKLLFKVTRKDLKVEFFRAGGKGGQHQNKTSSACRIRHPPSGAVGESREERSQHQNRRIAFKRMAQSKKFQNWARAQAAAIEQGYRDTEQKVSQMMASDNVKIDYVTTWECDGCGKTETITASDPNKKPEWLAIGELQEEEHLCTRCAGK